MINVYENKNDDDNFILLKFRTFDEQLNFSFIYYVAIAGTIVCTSWTYRRVEKNKGPNLLPRKLPLRGFPESVCGRIELKKC